MNNPSKKLIKKNLMKLIYSQIMEMTNSQLEKDNQNDLPSNFNKNK